MADCPDNAYNSTTSHISTCEDVIDPMNGAVIPTGIEAVEVFVGDAVEWDLSPAQPSTVLPNLLLNQSSGGILIIDGLYLAIE